MKPGIKKVTSGKTMRVATLFTGAAACAAAFAPAAYAANGHQAGLDGKKLTLGQHYGTLYGARPDDGPTSKSIQEASCATTPRWVHVVNGAHHECFGFHGTWAFSEEGYVDPVYVSKICGGNNYGWYVSALGRKGYYRQGTSYVPLPVSNMISIHISGWKGNDTCPAP